MVYKVRWGGFDQVIFPYPGRMGIMPQTASQRGGGAVPGRGALRGDLAWTKHAPPLKPAGGLVFGYLNFLELFQVNYGMFPQINHACIIFILSLFPQAIRTPRALGPGVLPVTGLQPV